MPNGEAMIVLLLTVGLIKKMYSQYIKMIEYFPKSCEPFGGDISAKLDLSNYSTKADLKGPRGADTFNLATTSDLASLKAEVDEIDID